MECISDVRVALRTNSSVNRSIELVEGRRWIYAMVVKAGGVDLSVCSNACFLLEVLNVRLPSIWGRVFCDTHTHPVPAACLRLAFKMDESFIYDTELYRIADLQKAQEALDRIEHILMEHTEGVSYYVHSPHSVIDQNQTLIATLPSGVVEYAHAYVREWLVHSSSCSMLTELTGSVALAAIACAVAVLSTTPEDIRQQIYALAADGFEGHYELEQCLKCVLNDEGGERGPVPNGHTTPPPPLKRRRVTPSPIRAVLPVVRPMLLPSREAPDEWSHETPPLRRRYVRIY